MPDPGDTKAGDHGQGTSSSSGLGGGSIKGSGSGSKDLGIAGVPGTVNRTGGKLAPAGGGSSGNGKQDLGIAGVPGTVNRLGGALAKPAGTVTGAGKQDFGGVGGPSGLRGPLSAPARTAGSLGQVTASGKVSAPPGSAGPAYARGNVGAFPSQGSGPARSIATDDAAVAGALGPPTQNRSRMADQYSQYQQPPSAPTISRDYSGYQSASDGIYGPRAGTRAPSYMQAQNIPGVYVGDTPVTGWNDNQVPGLDPNRHQPTEITIPGGDLPVGGVTNIAQNNLGVFGRGMDIAKNNEGVFDTPVGAGQTIAKNNEGVFDKPYPFSRYASPGLPPGYAAAHPIATPAAAETILSVENVPPIKQAPTAPAKPPPASTHAYDPIMGSPGDLGDIQMPKSPLGWTVGKRIAGALTGGLGSAYMNGLEKFGDYRWSKMSPTERLTQMDRWNADNKSYLSGGDIGTGHGPDRNQYAGINFAQFPRSAIGSAIDTGTSTPSTGTPDPWAPPKRVGNPADPYNYGYGPGYSYFNYG